MKGKILLVVLVLAAAGGYYGYSQYQEASDFAKGDGVTDLTGEGVRAGLSSEDPRVRADALAQLDKLPEAERTAALLGAIDSPSAATRLGAIAALGRVGKPDADAVAGLLEAAREDPDADVRDAAFRVLEKSGDPRVLSLAVELLSSTEAPLAARHSAARVLDRLTGRNTSEEMDRLFAETEAAADELSMDWDEWVEERRGTLRWDEEAGRFVE